MPKATCPTDPSHDRFVTTAHVQQDWVVNRDGDFVSELATLDTTHGPDSGNEWTCQTCGASALVSDGTEYPAAPQTPA